MLIKYIKSVLWRVAKRLSYIEEARCLKVNAGMHRNLIKQKEKASNNPLEHDTDGQCTYHVTVWHVHVTMFTKEKQQFVQPILLS